MTTVELTYRVDRLEDIILELANKINLCIGNINRLSDEMREYKERSERADENLRQELNRTFARIEQIRISAEKADENLRQELNRTFARMEQNEQKFQQDLVQIRASAEAENQKLRREAEAEYQKLRQDAEAENQKLRREAEAEYQKLRQEAEEDYKKMRQEMGKLSRKMGTLAEDLVAPSIPRLLKEVVGCVEVPRLIGVRMRLHHKGRSVEYDVVALCGEYLLINETKTKLQESDIQTFIERLKEARVFLPEYANYRIVGALASFYTDISLVLRGARMGIIMIGVGEGMMDVLNDSNFVPRTF